MSSGHDTPEDPQPGPTRESRFEPYEVNRPIPVAVLSVAFALAAWGVATLWVDQGAVEETAPEDEAAEVAAAGPDGAAVFEANCQTCHQANGLGVQGAIPPLAGSRYVTGPAEAPVQILLHGIDGPISVRGADYDGRMPRFGEVLTDAEIAAVVSYVRSTWGNAAPPVEAAFVAEQRARFDATRGPWAGGAELGAVTGIAARLGGGGTDTSMESAR